MSLRLRLLLMIGVSLSLLWSVVAVWMVRDLNQEIYRTLDRRLVMSAQMVAGLMAQNPEAWEGKTVKTELSKMTMPVTAEELACQVSSLSGEVLARTPGAIPETVIAQAPGFSEREINGERWRSFTFEGLGLRVTTADRLAERSNLRSEVVLAAAIPFVIAMIGSLLLLWFGVKRALVPLESLRQILAKRAPDTLTPIANSATPDELRPLVATLNQLLERITLALQRERRFTSDAAHELRTPLTAIKTHLQVARISDDKEAKIALEYAEEASSRLQHTLTQLLTLSQIEGPFSWGDVGGCDADAVARLAMRDAAPDAPLRIVVETDGRRAKLALPQALAVTALRNLLDNALRYSPAENSVSLRTVVTTESVIYYVSDNGPGLNSDDAKRALRRFWRRGSGHGSGLGLSIVAAINRHFGGKLELLAGSAGGLEVRLSLPRIPAGSRHDRD
ncbi:MAG: histidine kinase dimerization/phospho-acceptor domain-containing protein [Gammaproteobacteria bacterium]|nr:histidine kinase dimerization/phospho-acceptor domain-containing protein [Gammaproteobacteria bacterium]